MKAQAITAHPFVREDAGKIAIRRGPVIYCMEETDNGNNLHLAEIKLPLYASEVRTKDRGFDGVCLDIAGRKLQV